MGTMPAGAYLEGRRQVVVELRRTGGGMMPWALLAATYEPNPTGILEICVAHTGELASAPVQDCLGPLGRPLAVGLPMEFAEATLEGLTRPESAVSPSGQIRVESAAYHEADSSRFAFEHAAVVLRSILLARDSTAEFVANELSKLLRAFH